MLAIGLAGLGGVGLGGVVAKVTFLTVLGLACWMYGQMKLNWSVAARLVGTLATVGVAWGGGWFAYGYMYTGPEEDPPVVLVEG